MGRLFAIQFENPDCTDYFMCKGCRTHIALEDDHNSNYTPEPGRSGGLFNKVINVQVDEPRHHWQVGCHTVADIYCVKCGDNLGWKYIAVDKEARVKNNMVQLTMKKILLKKGDEIRDGETMMQVPEINNSG